VLLGQVDDIRPYVTQASVYIVPLRVGGGTRLKILDAMAMGKAIVSTAVGCEGIKVQDGKDIMIADEPKKFAAAILQLLHDQKLREEIGANARTTAEQRYSWKIIAPELDRAYQLAIACRRGSSTHHTTK
jgi:glycosyltransferase involved in cell wall biosynthesis